MISPFWSTTNAIG